MINKLIRDTELVGSIFSGQIRSLQDIDDILYRLNMDTECREVFCFCKDKEFEVISSLLCTPQTDASGVFNKKYPRDPTGFIVDMAFKRGKNNVYMINKPNIRRTIFMTQEDVEPSRCLIIEN